MRPTKPSIVSSANEGMAMINMPRRPLIRHLNDIEVIPDRSIVERFENFCHRAEHRIKTVDSGPGTRRGYAVYRSNECAGDVQRQLRNVVIEPPPASV